MSEIFETVISVDDYYDGPRLGVANFNGLPHRYHSFGWLPDGEWCSGYTPDEDRFYLAPVDAPPDAPEIVVRGEFRVRQPAPDLPPGVVRPLEVRWTVVPG